jgi:DNA-binding transcriptional MerR regulator
MSKATSPPSPTYKTQQFASLTGVSVRALHHYDRLGLLKPRRSSAGYRIYTDADVSVLEQIVALKFIGLPLRAIPRLLKINPADLARTLAAQRLALEEKRRLLDLAITAVRQAEASILDQPVVTTLTRILEVIAMQNTDDEWTKKYDALVQGKVEHLQAMPAATRNALRQQWADLFKDVERALARDPASPEAQALGDRWLKLLEPFAAGPIDPALVASFGGASNPAQAWPQSRAAFGDRRVWDFMRQVLTARSQ